MQALRSGQIARQIFNDLDRRLKSTEKKEQSRVIGQERDSVQKQKTKTTEDRPPDNQTTSTTVVSHTQFDKPSFFSQS